MNTGNSPAYDLTYECWWWVRDWPLPDDAPFKGETPSPPFKAEKFILHGGGDKRKMEPFNHRDIVRHAKMHVAENQAQRLYVFGMVTYRDTFGEPHKTEFCYVAHTGHLGIWHIRYFDRHNEAD